MKTRILSPLFASLALAAFVHAAPAKLPAPENNIWFNKEAQTFDSNNGSWKIIQDSGRMHNGRGWEFEGLPVGNGRIGAMVLDSAARERIALNEATFWSGGENADRNCSGYTYGPLAERNQFGSYQPFGDFLAEFSGIGDEPKDFVRNLNLETGIAKTAFTSKGVKYTRSVFASQEHNVITIIYKASKKGALSGTFALAPNHSAKFFAQSNKLGMTGTLANDMKFAARAQIINKGGKLSPVGGNANIDVTYAGKGDNQHAVYNGVSLPRIKVQGADEIIVVIALATDYVMDAKKNWKGADPVSTAEKTLKAAVAVAEDPTAMTAAHVRIHQEMFKRVKVDFGKTDAETAKLPTPERLKKYATTQKDPDLEETLFQFGRYCLLSSSRGSAPATLQGIWNHKVHAPWACDYHTNINIQEAYWPAEVCNLSECAMPLINWLDATREISAGITQRAFTNHEGRTPRGWTARVSQNIFGAGGWTMWNTVSSAWYALHVWEHFAFTQDKKFLKEQGYPMMKEICHFWEDMLKPLGENGAGFNSNDPDADLTQLKGIPTGTLVAPDGWSHEWGPVEDGVAHDQQVIYNLFTNTIEAAKILGVDRKWADELTKKRDLLYGNKISKNGYLQEWMIDRPDKVSGHRHTSHLFAVYPGSQISMAKTPELAEAAKKSLELRGTTGDSRRSWSWPWRTALWARFKEGDKAHEMIQGLLTYNTLPNLLTTHEPFQMDGNFAFPAAVAEMLVQSHAGEIELLPAPCSAWKSGKVSGLKARGNITVSFEWKDGRVNPNKIKLVSPKEQKVTLVVNGKKYRVKTVTEKKTKTKAATPKEGKSKATKSKSTTKKKSLQD